MNIKRKSIIVTTLLVSLAVFTSKLAFVTAKDANEPSTFEVKRALKYNNIIPVAIIGAGPAGMCAAIYTLRDNLPTYMFTGGNIGGYLNEIKHIENIMCQPRMAGAKVAEELQKQVERFGVKFVNEKVISIDVSNWPYLITTADGQSHALSIIITSGFSPKKADIPGVDKYWGLGVSTCTLCDAPFHKDQEVIVAGGNDYAAERTLQLAAYAKKVTMVVKEPRLTATAIVQDYLRARPNINMIFNSEITRILGDDKQVTGVEVYDHAKKTIETLPAEGVYVNSEYVPNSDFAKGQLVMDAKGYITLMPGSQQTSAQGVFAAGTVADSKYGKVMTSSGDGAKAGMEAAQFMHKKVGFYDSENQGVQQSLLHVDTEAQEEIPHLKTQKELLELVRKHSIVVIYFYRLVCPVCQNTIEVIRNVNKEFSKDVYVVKANAHTAKQLARDIGVTGVPYVVVYKNGVIEERIRGVEIKDKLYGTLERLLGPEGPE